MRSINSLNRPLQKITNVLHRYWPLLVFLAFMLWQQAYVYLYHDDFGYATLSYLGPLSDGSTVNGHEFNYGQMLAFLRMHYLTWGGRVLPFFELLVLLRWSIWVYRILHAVVLTLILFLGTKLVESERESNRGHWKAALMIVSLYGLIPILLQNEGTYWATGAVLYAWPFLWIFGAGILLWRYSTRKMHKAWLGLLFFLFWGSGFSQEQVFFVALFMLLGFLVSHLAAGKDRSVIITDIACLLALCFGFLLLMIAPGNQIRAALPAYRDFYALGWFDRIRANLPVLLEITFGRSNLTIFIFLMLANLISLIPALYKKNGFRIPVLILSLLQGIFIILLGLMILTAFSFVRSLPFGKLFNLIDSFRTHSILFWLVMILTMSIPVFIQTLRRRSYVMLGLYVGGAAALASSLVIPTVQYRSILLLLFPLIVVIAWMLIVGFTELKCGFVTRVVLGILVLLAVVNSAAILRGYLRNSPIQVQNQRVMTSAGESIANGSTVKEIHLQKLIDDRYAAKMPYEANYDYINAWMKDYYKIPQSVEILWDAPTVH